MRYQIYPSPFSLNLVHDIRPWEIERRRAFQHIHRPLHLDVSPGSHSEMKLGARGDGVAFPMMDNSREDGEKGK